MTLSVNAQGYEYQIEFTFDGEVTFCNITEVDGAGIVVASGHSLQSSEDDYDKTKGAKIALERALDTHPIEFFDRTDRRKIWAKFWLAFLPEEIDHAEAEDFDYVDFIENLHDRVAAIENFLNEAA